MIMEVSIGEWMGQVAEMDAQLKLASKNEKDIIRHNLEVLVMQGVDANLDVEVILDSQEYNEMMIWYYALKRTELQLETRTFPEGGYDVTFASMTTIRLKIDKIKTHINKLVLESAKQEALPNLKRIESNEN